MTDDATYQKFVERYADGRVPWDDELPPPEVVTLLDTIPPGRALDLGCGYGRAAILMARHGWQIDAIDYVPEAIAGATDRARAAGVAGQIRFHIASVTDLDFLDGPYDLALDVGCMHALTGAGLGAYRDELCRLLRPSADYLLFVHLRDEQAGSEIDARGLSKATIDSLFAEGFNLEQLEHGLTQVEDQPPWHSAWFWYRRR
jgi:SAM-dependent methyltransferase